MQNAFVGQLADAPAARRARRVARGPHQPPVVVVGHQRERHAALAAPGLSPLERTGWPGVASDSDVGPPVEARSERPDEDRHPNLVGVVDVEQGLGRAKVDAVFCSTHQRRRRQLLPFG